MSIYKRQTTFLPNTRLCNQLKPKIFVNSALNNTTKMLEDKDEWIRRNKKPELKSFQQDDAIIFTFLNFHSRTWHFNTQSSFEFAFYVIFFIFLFFRVVILGRFFSSLHPIPCQAVQWALYSFISCMKIFPGIHEPVARFESIIIPMIPNLNPSKLDSAHFRAAISQTLQL